MKIVEILGTGYMDKSFKNEKDFFAKYFTRPFLTRKARKDRPIRVKVNKKGLPEFYGVPIPSTARPQGIKKVTKKLAGKTRTFYEPISKDRFNEKWSDKYKRSIDCANPKGFSQKAHCAGKKKDENFADGKKPGRKGLSQRVGIPKGASISQLEKYAKAKGEKGRMARWQLNMRRGKSKSK